MTLLLNLPQDSDRIQREQSMPANGAELVAYWEREGVIGMRSDITDAQAYARELRANAEHRHPKQPYAK